LDFPLQKLTGAQVDSLFKVTISFHYTQEEVCHFKAGQSRMAKIKQWQSSDHILNPVDPLQPYTVTQFEVSKIPQLLRKLSCAPGSIPAIRRGVAMTTL
jgi:hypothetical protein